MEAQLVSPPAQDHTEVRRPPSVGARVLLVFYAPGRLFERLAARPLWGAALLLGAALMAASFLLIPTEIWEQSIREQLLSAGRELPEGFAVAGIMRILGAVGPAVFWCVLAFFLAGVLTFVFAFVLGDDARYRQYLSVASHALLIAALGSLALVPLKLAQRDPQLTLNLSLFAVGLDDDGYPFPVLRLLDLFALWSYAVMAVGVAKLDPRRSWRSAAACLAVFAVGMALVLGIFTPA